MKRDGNSTSVWQLDAATFSPKAPPLPPLAEVLVVGAGITGLTTALNLQRAGVSCVVAEAFNIGFGTTGGTTAHLNTLLDTTYDEVISAFGEERAKLLAKAAQEAIRTIRTNAMELATDCEFMDKDGYLLALNKEQDRKLDAIIKSAVTCGLDMAHVQEMPAPLPFLSAARITHQAQFHPIRYIRGLAKAFEGSGGIILEHCHVGDVEGKGPFHVHTSQGKIVVDHVVFATHIPPGVNLMDFRCAPYRSYAMAVSLEDEAYPDAVIYDLEDPYHYYRTQRIAGKPLLIVGGFDHKTAHEADTRRPAAELEAHVRKHFKVGDVHASWSAQYYEPVDGLPYIGQLPGASKHQYVATGFGGNGMIYGTLSGSVLTDLVLGKENAFADLFDPARVSLIHGFRKFTTEAADVAGKWIGGRLGLTELTDLATGLRPGEGAVVKYKGQRLAVSKDEAGHIVALDPTCTHIGCTVAWNTLEASWDCPCHGGRFDRMGRVITGPPPEPLEGIDPAV